jgi:two-component system, NtrC family, sensor kinase
MEHSPATSALSRPRVYLAEDSRSQRRLYAAILDDDFEVVQFDNGRALLAAAMASLPDVVVSDVEMPEMDGLTLTRRLKAEPFTRAVPVILLTAGDGRSVSSCLDAGADDFLRKPVQADELAARARSCARGFATYKELQASEARTMAILEGARAGIVTTDGQGRIESVNRSAERMFGWSRSETASMSILDLLSPGPARTAMAGELVRLSQGGGTAPAERLEVVGRHRSGVEFPVDCSLNSVDTPAGPVVCAFLRDLTSSRRMEAALRQAQQLEAIGRLAAGIAHEINTPVQCIQDSLEFLRESVESLAPVVASYRALADAADVEHGPLAERAREAENGADLDYMLQSAAPAARRALEMARRIAAIVRATKDFAGPEGGRMIAVDLPAALRTVLGVSYADHAGVADVELEAEPLSIVCQPSALNDAVRHLIVNAAHAIADTGRRGTIRVRAYLDGGDVVVSVADDGCGIAPEHADRIFEPFFTTKEVGRGVGLGLFVASAAARQHEGSLTFESAPGRGSTFWLRLQISPTPAAD